MTDKQPCDLFLRMVSQSVISTVSLKIDGADGMFNAFLGLGLLMHERSWTIDDYWKKNPFFSTVMSCSRWRKIRTLMRYSGYYKMYSEFFDHPGNSHDDSVNVMDNVIEKLNASWSEMYIRQGRELCLDESTVKYGGRCPLTQFHQRKPAKQGITIISLCESCTGYCIGITLFKGKYPANENNTTLMKKMLQPVANTDHVIVTDSAYSTERNFIMMREELGLKAYGTANTAKAKAPAFIKKAEDPTVAVQRHIDGQLKSMKKYLEKVIPVYKDHPYSKFKPDVHYTRSHSVAKTPRITLSNGVDITQLVICYPQKYLERAISLLDPKTLTVQRKCKRNGIRYVCWPKRLNKNWCRLPPLPLKREIAGTRQKNYFAARKKGLVCLITTLNDKSVQGFDKETKRPRLLEMFNENKGGVDRMNRVVSDRMNYSKTYRWTERLFWWLMNICLNNAYILWTHSSVSSNNNNMTRTQFRNSVVKGLVTDKTS